MTLDSEIKGYFKLRISFIYAVQYSNIEIFIILTLNTNLPIKLQSFSCVRSLQALLLIIKTMIKMY